MGVRFACHACGKRLNIKTELAGRRGICPACSVRFRIPAYDTETSTPLESDDFISGGDSHSEHASQTSDAGGVAVQSQPTTTSSQKPAADNSTENSPNKSPNKSAATQESAQSGTTATTEPTFEEILGGPTATWYVRPPSGGQYGPADGPTMGEWMKEGRVADVAMVWRDGWNDWRVAKEVIPGVVSASTPTTTIAPSSSPDDRQPTATIATNPSESLGAAGTPDSVTERAGPLTSNKKKRSQKRIVISIVLALIFIGLVGALVFVVQR